MIKGGCSTFSPEIIDTDGALRWVGPAGVARYTSAFFDNAVYIADTGLTRMDLDGSITAITSNTDLGVTFLHHNIDPGKFGLILEVDTAEELESVNIEVDAAGKILKEWDLAQIISDAMTAGGDDPSKFVFPSPFDWFHNNATTYNRADDSLIVSSRENFVICLDYETGAIKWILGDTTKLWYTFLPWPNTRSRSRLAVCRRSASMLPPLLTTRASSFLITERTVNFLPVCREKIGCMPVRGNIESIRQT